jgi:N-ethylmaleimide reductase
MMARPDILPPLLEPYTLGDLPLRNRVLHHFRRLYHGTLILHVGIDPRHGAELLRDGLGDLIACGRAYIANPDLVERIRLDAPLNDQRPESYYGSPPVGYMDYPFIGNETVGRTGESDVID